MLSELDLKALWKELDDYEVELDKETKSLQEVWVKIAQIKATNEIDLSRFVHHFSFVMSSSYRVSCNTLTLNCAVKFIIQYYG